MTRTAFVLTSFSGLSSLSLEEAAPGICISKVAPLVSAAAAFATTGVGFCAYFGASILVKATIDAFASLLDSDSISAYVSTLASSG